MRLVVVKVVVVLATSVELVQSLVEYCHLTMLPVLPSNVRALLFEPEHTVAEPETDPPAETGLTVTVASEELVAEHTPL